MRFTKRFNVQITGTMANFEAEGPSLATWRPVEGQHVKIFTNANTEQDLGSAIKGFRSSMKSDEDKEKLTAKEQPGEVIEGTAKRAEEKH